MNRTIWIVMTLVLAGALVFAWVGLPRMMKHDGLANALPPARAAAPETNALETRLKSAEDKLNALPKERAGLNDRMGQIDKSLSAGIRRARTEATALVEGVKREMGRNLEAIHARLTGIESVQRESHDEVARLQAELAQAQRDLVAMRQTSAEHVSRIDRIEQAQEYSRNEVSGLQSRITSSQRKMDSLAYQVERNNVSFEVSKDRAEEIFSGVYLTIKSANVARQQVDGWVQLAADGRFVRLRDAGAQTAITFSSRGDERGYQLVFTRVTENSVAGYLLVPATSGLTETASK